MNAIIVIIIIIIIIIIANSVCGLCASLIYVFIFFYSRQCFVVAFYFILRIPNQNDVSQAWYLYSRDTPFWLETLVLSW